MITISLQQIRRNPAQVLVLGFGGLILLGATLLNLPMASINGKSIGFIDALFTSASAVCVTGLAVVNTAAHWTLFGKIVILILIQIGGLGFMTMATLIALLLGKRITLKERLIIQEEMNQFNLSGLVKLIKYVVISTFLVEAIGAFFLATRFIPTYGVVTGIWFSIFHSISAFCNAGFDITGASMEPFVGDFVVNVTIGALVILGGLGYSVYLDVTRSKKFKRFTLHTKLVLTISGFLLLLGFIFIFIIEFTNPLTLGEMSFGNKILAAGFQSIITRTAGFNTVDIGLLNNATAFFIIIFMFIGGSPSSTAGGIKTTTIGAIVLGIISVVKGEDDIEIFKKRIPHELVYRAIAVVGIGLLIVILVTMLLSITEQGSFIDILFETTSAFGTVGLSRGITSNLTIIGRLIITVTMFVGRLGPLTLAFAFAKKSKERKGMFRYPEEKIFIG